MENDNNPKTNSSDDEQLVSETSIGSNRERSLMLHQEIKVIYPQIKAPSHRIAMRVKCQNLLVIKVCNNMICFSSYYLLVHLKWKVIVNFLKAAKGIVPLTLYQCHSSLIAIFN